MASTSRNIGWGALALALGLVFSVTGPQVGASRVSSVLKGQGKAQALLRGARIGKGTTVMHVHDNVVPRHLLDTTCGRSSISMTDRFMFQWSLSDNLYELNFTNNCAYPVVGNAYFSQCAGFSNMESIGLVNPHNGDGLTCHQGPTFLLVSVYYQGYTIDNSLCQLRMYQGTGSSACTNAIQIQAGQRITLYYFNSDPFNVCLWQATYAYPSPNTTTFQETSSIGANCAEYKTFTFPSGYECQVGDNIPGLIYCPWVSGN